MIRSFTIWFPFFLCVLHTLCASIVAQNHESYFEPEFRTTTFVKENSDFPDNGVRALTETSDKALWVGTMSGLARFHEGTWQVFTTKNSDLPYNEVLALTETSDKALWVGTNGGLARFHEGTWQVFTTENSDLPCNWVGALTETSDKALWVGKQWGQVYY